MTELGIVASTPPFVVGPDGSIGSLAGEMTVQWWIAAEDRWHLVPTEAAVRQGLGDDAISVETRVRIPGGDAVLRTTAVPAAGSAAALVEMENASPAPVALAAVVTAPSDDVVIEGDTVWIGRQPVLRFARPIAGALATRDLAGARDLVTSGATAPPAASVWPQVAGAAVAVVPVPHRTRLRCAVAGPGMGALPSPTELPPLEAVGRGWQAQLGAGMRVGLGDERTLAVVDAARRHLLAGSMLGPDCPFWSVGVRSWVPPVAAVALAAWGHGAEARELLLRASGDDDLLMHAARPIAAGGALLWAWAEELARAPDQELEAALVPWVEEVVVGLLRRPARFRRQRTEPDDAAWRALGLASASAIMGRGSRAPLGADIVDALPALVAEIDPSVPSLPLGLGAGRLGLDPPRLGPALALDGPVDDHGGGPTAFTRYAGPTGALAHGERSQHPALSALLLLSARRSLLVERGSGGDLDVMPEPEDEWVGSAIDVENAPVSGGVASFGIRWHGDRPALLWDVSTSRAAVALRSSGLDPSWRGDGPRGEALLGPTAGLREGPRSPMPQPGVRLDPPDGGSFG